MKATIVQPSEAEYVREGYGICKRCVMDTCDPEISFDSTGICNHCHSYEVLTREKVHSGATGVAKLGSIVEEIRTAGKGKAYDCVIGVSGGVDSTFVASKTKELGLRPLAVHLDNGWDSEIAVSNINKALKKLDIDLQTLVLDWEEFKDIQRAFLRASTPDAEIPSDHAIFAALYQTASKIGVRYVITGLNVRTETHMPPAWSQGYWDWGYIRDVHRQFGSRPIKSFPHFTFYQYITGSRHSHVTVDLLNYIDYSKKEALVALQNSLGWKDYGGKHFESVYTRWFQGCYLPRKFGFDKRRSHLSSRICSGEVSREEALKELNNPPYSERLQEEDCEYVAKKLNLDAREFESIMSAPPRRFEDFHSYQKVREGKLFKRTLKAHQFLKYDLLRRPR